MPRKAALPAFCDTIGTISALQFGARRLPELKALHHVATNTLDVSIAANPHHDLITALRSGGRKTSSRHLRRRATSHRRYKSRYQSRKQNPIGTDVSPKDSDSRRDGRRWRRQIGRLMSIHESWRHGKAPLRKGSQGQSERNVHWMTTHLWHRKRFHMQSLWNWYVPLLHTNRGCAATIRLVTLAQKCLMQDVTWSIQPVSIRIQKSCDLTWLRGIIPEFTLEATTDETCFREGVLYEPNCFPQNAIGPVTWLYSTAEIALFSTAIPTSASSEYSYLYLFMHPSIQPSVQGLLEKICPPNLDQGPMLGTDGGIACLQLRGSNVACLDCLITSLDFHTHDAASESFSLDHDASISANTQNQFLRHIVSSPHNTIITAPLASDNVIIIRRVAPRNDECLYNWGVCGVDIYCSPNDCKSLFQSFVLKGGACPIGIVEATYLSLESDPPLLVFPRDYPDTLEGLRYWEGTGTEWQCVRHYWEGGSGRISNNTNPNHLVIKWSRLVGSGPSETFAVVVRGKEFGEPFQRALAGWTHPVCPIRTTGSKVTPKRRLHRSLCGMTHWTTAVVAPRLAASDCVAHEQTCRSFISSLSLPALLLCTVRLLGSGSLQAGCCIHSDSDGHRLLGHVTTGSFSTARGHYHGLAIVGAFYLLQYLLESSIAPTSSVVIASCSMGGPKNVQCKVFVQSRNCSHLFYEASLALYEFCGDK